VCSFVHGEEKAVEEDNIAAGARWKDGPQGWSCPDSGAAKSDFMRRKTG